MVLYPVPHRQYVFSIPKILRKFFLYDRKLLGKLSQCAAKSLTKFLGVTLGKKSGIPGIVLSIQSFGDYARWRPLSFEDDVRQEQEELSDLFSTGIYSGNHTAYSGTFLPASQIFRLV